MLHLYSHARLGGASVVEDELNEAGRAVASVVDFAARAGEYQVLARGAGEGRLCVVQTRIGPDPDVWGGASARRAHREVGWAAVSAVGGEA
ncbi:hypothetical protein, partial [Burkholderia pseudomallei]|uniref:hypothetical protein n=1 Tax=Burkholderia pseudomallei TaxID=28450 RepID=UPI000CCF743A